jgi:hypothetical protein
MVRHSLAIFACVLLLAGCGDHSLVGTGLARRGAPMMDMVSAGAPPQPAQQFSYSHTWNLIMGHGAVAPRFERARAACLRDRTLSCRLVSANLTVGDPPDNPVTFATLQVLLPHGQLDAFEKGLRQPLPGEAAGDVIVTSRATQAQSVENEAGDTERKVAQLTAYRDRLATLAQRPNLSVDDIIRLESEQSRVQGELDDAVAHKRDLTDGIARESVTVQLMERTVPTGPFLRVLNEAGETFVDSAASALEFVIAAVPWLPILAAGLFLVSWLWRLFRRRREKAA